MQRGAIEEDYWRPLLLFAMLLDLDVLRLRRAVAEGHVLQLALAARVAHRAVKGMVAEQEFDGGFACLRNLRRFGLDHHAFGYRRSAGGLQLGHLLDADDAHATRRLQRKSGIVAEGGNLEAGSAAGLDEQGARGCGELLAVYGETYISHGLRLFSWIRLARVRLGEVVRLGSWCD